MLSNLTLLTNLNIMIYDSADVKNKTEIDLDLQATKTDGSSTKSPHYLYKLQTHRNYSNAAHVVHLYRNLIQHHRTNAFYHKYHLGRAYHM